MIYICTVTIATMGNTPRPNWLKIVRTPTSTSCPSPITTPSVPPKKRWKLPDLLGGIIDLGIDGIEAFSSYHTPSQTADALAVAQAHGLFVTCGSDFHGKTKPSIALRQHGCTIPGEEMERQMEALLERVI